MTRKTSNKVPAALLQALFKRAPTEQTLGWEIKGSPGLGDFFTLKKTDTNEEFVCYIVRYEPRVVRRVSGSQREEQGAGY